MLNDETGPPGRSNVIETRKVSERLEDAVARHHASAISTVEDLQELIGLAQHVRESRRRGQDAGLSPEEIAFHDALADNRSAVEVLGNDQLKVIAHERLTSLQATTTVDGAHRAAPGAAPRAGETDPAETRLPP